MRIMNRHIRHTILLTLAIVVMAACGGGGSDVPSPAPTPTPTPTPTNPTNPDPEPTPTPTPTPTPEPVSSCKVINVVAGDTLGAIMKRCEGKVEWGEAMNEYAAHWYSLIYTPERTVLEGWRSSTGVGLRAGDKIEWRE